MRLHGYVGIDLAIAKGKRLPICVCTWRAGRVVPEPLRSLGFEPPRGQGNPAVLDEGRIADFVEAAAEYVRAVCANLDITPRRIGIDAPSAPRKPTVLRRAAEAAMDEAGISCFTTPSAAEFEAIRAKARDHLAAGGAASRLPHANQLWMLVGFRLFEAMRAVAPCVEVFPQATVRALGVGQVHKLKEGGVEAQLAAVARHTGWPSAHTGDPDFSEIAFGPGHDRLDAYLSAWVAALDEQDRVAFGSPPDDVIWTPRLPASARAPVPEGIAGRSLEMRPVRSVKRPRAWDGHARPCPACNNHVFQRWPWGWDAHAAHRCQGLAADGEAARKEEFKRRFGHLFAQAG